MKKAIFRGTSGYMMENGALRRTKMNPSCKDLRQLKLTAFKMGADVFRRRMDDWLNDTFEYENSVMTVHRVRETLIATTAEMSRIQEDL
jgi:hypothetical protein